MKKYYIILMAIISLVSCSKGKEYSPISESLGIPNIITDVKATPAAGGVDITYSIPADKDILYVEAHSKLANGAEKIARTSYFDNKISIRGYVSQEAQTATLYTVNRAQEKSKGITVNFEPLASPMKAVEESLKIIGDFGGVTFEWLNPESEPLTMEFLAPDSLGKFSTVKILSTNADTAKMSLRGYDPEPIKVGVIISDNYGNVSDTLKPADGIVTPYYEQEIPKDNLHLLYLDGDISLTAHGGKDEGFLDDNFATFGHSDLGTIPGGSYGIDYGTTIKCSRFVFWHGHAAEWTYYWWGSVKTFELWVTNEVPNQNGTFDGWRKLGDYEITRPSGPGIGADSEEDYAMAKEGHNFNIPLTEEPFRYIRFVFNTTWGNTGFVHPSGFKFFGQIAE